MSSKFVRSSKYRHVHGSPNKPEKTYVSIKVSKSPSESNMCSVNSKFVAVVLEAQGGGAFLVLKEDNYGRVDLNHPKVCGHTAPVLDIQWNPFDENEIASCSEDTTVKIWTIPDGGLVEDLKDPRLDLMGHEKKSIHVHWHPTAANILASSSADGTILIWNTTAGGEPLYRLTQQGVMNPELVYSFSWNYNGSQIVSTSKDKKLRLYDVRKEAEIQTVANHHLGSKPSRVVFLGSTNKLFTTGFSKMSERGFALYDSANLSKVLCSENIDSGTGVLFPFWDEETKMVYIVGKGDTNIRYYEVTNEEPFVFFLSINQSTVSVRGVGILPKRLVNVREHEICRFYRVLQTKGIVEPLSMIVPRKSEMLQKDVYLPCYAGKPSMTAEEWIGGANKNPILINIGLDGPIAGTESVSKVDAQPKAEKIGVSGGSEPKTLEDFKKVYKELLAENEKLKKELGRK